MDRRIELVISEIEDDLAHAWELVQIAEMVHLSPSRFRHLFKQEMGESVNKYLRERRLERAEYLLRTTFLSIKEVKKLAGLSRTSHFVEYFKKRYGVAPSAYRKTVAIFDKQ